ncbi:phage tail terminator-like protein [Bosea eneae]|uniref:Phage tail terminator-like protein n=1 Tax=Bosea eneae TaxID=151454 RepID=A0ABW0IYK9_9HYPH
MASLAVITAVKARLAGFPTPLRWPNESARTPANGSTFVTVQFPVATEEQISFGAPGANVFREEGAIRFVISARRGVGPERAAEIAEDLRALFRNARFDGVRCYAPSSPVFDDRGDDAGYFLAAIVVPYDHDTFA